MGDNKHVRKAIVALVAQIERHQAKIDRAKQTGLNLQDVPHWEQEIRAWQKRIARRETLARWIMAKIYPHSDVSERASARPCDALWEELSEAAREYIELVNQLKGLPEDSPLREELEAELVALSHLAVHSGFLEERIMQGLSTVASPKGRKRSA